MHNCLLLLAALVFLPFTVGQAPFDLYKLSLRWPPSECNIGQLKCTPTVLNYWVIHGIWPTYENNTAVPQYDKTKNSCAHNPTKENQIKAKLSSIKNTLTQFWPSLRNYAKDKTNLKDWIHEWKFHGQCSDYPTDPLSYFNSALSLRRKNDLAGTRIQPREEPYQAKEIVDAVKQILGATPEITCNTHRPSGMIQLREVRMCFKRAKPPTEPRDCPIQFSGTCNKESDHIRVPPAPSPGHSQVPWLPINIFLLAFCLGIVI
ncbi:hypothetical protein SCA6_001023 [Theobroma cacao]